MITATTVSCVCRMTIGAALLADVFSKHPFVLRLEGFSFLRKMDSDNVGLAINHSRKVMRGLFLYTLFIGHRFSHLPSWAGSSLILLYLFLLGLLLSNHVLLLHKHTLLVHFLKCLPHGLLFPDKLRRYLAHKVAKFLQGC